MKELSVDVWSDIVCPWCYVGKRRLEAALARFPHRNAVVVTWRAFELDPSASREAGPPLAYAERLATKYGSSVRDADAMIARMTEVAKLDGLALRFDRARPGNSFDAHRVLHLAGVHGVQDAVKERFLRGYMSEGEAIGDPDVLVRLAAEAGLDGEEVRAVLTSDAYKREVREEESDAAELGITGVPFFVIGGRYAISGAQPADVLLRALEQAWKDVTSRPPPSLPKGPPVAQRKDAPEPMAADYPITITLPVQWSDMDALGHVNNARFFSWFESARIALFEKIGVATAGPHAVGPVLATTSCDFVKPVVYPATVRIGVRVTRVGETSIGMEYEVADAPDGQLYARGTSVAVLIDYRSSKKVRIPDDVREAIAALGAPSA